MKHLIFINNTVSISFLIKKLNISLHFSEALISKTSFNYFENITVLKLFFLVITLRKLFYKKMVCKVITSLILQRKSGASAYCLNQPHITWLIQEAKADRRSLLLFYLIINLSRFEHSKISFEMYFMKMSKPLVSMMIK